MWADKAIYRDTTKPLVFFFFLNIPLRNNLLSFFNESYLFYYTEFFFFFFFCVVGRLMTQCMYGSQQRNYGSHFSLFSA